MFSGVPCQTSLTHGAYGALGRYTVSLCPVWVVGLDVLYVQTQRQAVETADLIMWNEWKCG